MSLVFVTSNECTAKDLERHLEGSHASKVAKLKFHYTLSDARSKIVDRDRIVMWGLDSGESGPALSIYDGGTVGVRPGPALSFVREYRGRGIPVAVASSSRDGCMEALGAGVNAIFYGGTGKPELKRAIDGMAAFYRFSGGSMNTNRWMKLAILFKKYFQRDFENDPVLNRGRAD